MSPRQRKPPKHDDAALALDKLIETPKEKPKSALAEFVEKHFDKLVEAAQTNYSLTEICELLKKFNISASTQSLKQAMTAHAQSIGQLESLPQKLRSDLPPSNSASTKGTDVVATSVASSEIEQEKPKKSSIKSSSSIANQFNV